MKKLLVIAGILLAGTLSAQISTDIYTIQSQMDATGASLWVDSVVTVSGVVTAGYGVTGSANFFLEMKQGGPYSGIMVYVPASLGTFPVNLGDSLTVTGTVSEYYDNTELGVADTNDIARQGTTTLPPVAIVTCDYLDTTATTTIPWDSAEAYEGVLVQVKNAVVDSALNAAGNFQIGDGTGYAYVRNNYSYTPAVGDYLNVTGIVHTHYNYYKLRPRTVDDIELLSPGLTNAYATDVNAINVIFNTPMGSSAEDPAKYAISPSLTVNSATVDAQDAKVVHLSTDVMLNAQAYTLIVQGLTDSAGNAVPEDTIVFYGGFTPIALIQGDTVAGDTSGNYPSNWADRVVTITGVVTASENSFTSPYFFVQQGDTALTGVQIWDISGDCSNINEGDSVIIAAQVQEYQGGTELSNIIYKNVVGASQVPAPINVNTGDLIPGAGFTAEKYEGVLVKVSHAIVTDEGTGGAFVVDDGTGGVNVTNRSAYSYTPHNNDALDVTGILRFVAQLYPRSDNDVVFLNVNEDRAQAFLRFNIRPLYKGKASFEFASAANGKVDISVYNIAGRMQFHRIMNTVHGSVYSVNLPVMHSGVYFVRLRQGNFIYTRKTTILK